MRNARGAVSRVWLPLVTKTLGALALGAAVVTPIEVLGAPSVGAAPAISFILAANLSTGAPITTLSGTVFLDAGITPTPGSHIIDVEYELIPLAPIECDPPRSPCTPIPITGTPAVEPTLVGWLGKWDTTARPNGTWQIAVVAEDVDNATGTVHSTTTSSPISVTVNNPPPTTFVGFPSFGATVSGNQYLDAGASPGVTHVQYELTGGPDNLDQQVISGSTPTYYGWIGGWATTSVPNGAYLLQSAASYAGGVYGLSSYVPITVNNP